MSRETVMHPAEELELTIETVNQQGEGVARHKGMAVFVPWTIPGEQVLARITGLKRNFAIAKALKIISASDKRINPACHVFTSCGGSQFQHIDYGFQLQLKKRLVEDALKRIGRLTGVAVNPTVGMTEPWGYRNKAQFQVNLVEDKIKLGFFAEGTHTLVPTTDCLLLDRQIRDIASMVEGMLNKYRVPVYDWDSGRGLLRHVVIRKGSDTAKVMVVLVTSAEKFPEQIALAREMRAKVPPIVSVVRNINPTPARQVFGPESQLLAGQSSLTEQLGGLTFTISPTSFFQVNSGQAEVLYAKAVEFAGLSGSETVLDVYCGTGTLSLFLAQRAGRVFGFEVSREAVRDAAANARLNRITNVEFVSGKAEERLPRLVKQGINPDVVVVDPPRQGMEKKALQAIADLRPERIVYISCDPATMARDLNFLSYRKYKVGEVQPVDMFPQTSHVECVAGIERQSQM